jgi:hypothetical protein
VPISIPRHSQHPLVGSGHTLARNLSRGVSFIGIHLKKQLAALEQWVVLTAANYENDLESELEMIFIRVLRVHWRLNVFLQSVP